MRGAALVGGIVGGGGGPAVQTVPPWPTWWRRRTRGPALGCRPPVLAGGEKGFATPARPLAVAPLAPGPPG